MTAPTETRIDTCEGKYTVILRSDGTSTALRYGEAWPAYEGCAVLDNLTTALARDLDDARRKLEEAHAAVLRGNAIASEFSEGCIEEARQANAEGDEKADREWCGRANGFDKISNAMQPVLGLALREERAAFLKSDADKIQAQAVEI